MFGFRSRWREPLIKALVNRCESLCQPQAHVTAGNGRGRPVYPIPLFAVVDFEVLKLGFSTHRRNCQTPEVSPAYPGPFFIYLDAAGVRCRATKSSTGTSIWAMILPESSDWDPRCSSERE